MNEAIDQAAWWEMHKHDHERVKKAIYEAYFDLRSYERHRSVWVMSKAMEDLLANIFLPLPPEPPPSATPVTLQPSLLGLPIDIREDVEGIRLVAVLP